MAPTRACQHIRQHTVHCRHHVALKWSISPHQVAASARPTALTRLVLKTFMQEGDDGGEAVAELHAGAHTAAAVEKVAEGGSGIITTGDLQTPLLQASCGAVGTLRYSCSLHQPLGMHLREEL